MRCIFLNFWGKGVFVAGCQLGDRWCGYKPENDHSPQIDLHLLLCCCFVPWVDGETSRYPLVNSFWAMEEKPIFPGKCHQNGVDFPSPSLVNIGRVHFIRSRKNTHQRAVLKGTDVFTHYARPYDFFFLVGGVCVAANLDSYYSIHINTHWNLWYKSLSGVWNIFVKPWLQRFFSEN